MKNRYEIQIRIAKTLLIFAESEEDARSKIQDYVSEHPYDVETLSVKEVKSFFQEEKKSSRSESK